MSVNKDTLLEVVKSIKDKMFPDLEIEVTTYQHKAAYTIKASKYDSASDNVYSSVYDVSDLMLFDKSASYYVDGMLYEVVKHLSDSINQSIWSAGASALKGQLGNILEVKEPKWADTVAPALTYKKLEEAYQKLVVGSGTMWGGWDPGPGPSYKNMSKESTAPKPTTLTEMYANDKTVEKPKKLKLKHKLTATEMGEAAAQKAQLDASHAQLDAKMEAAMVAVEEQMKKQIADDFFKESPLLSYLKSGGSVKASKVENGSGIPTATPKAASTAIKEKSSKIKK